MKNTDGLLWSIWAYIYNIYHEEVKKIIKKKKLHFIPCHAELFRYIAYVVFHSAYWHWHELIMFRDKEWIDLINNILDKETIKKTIEERIKFTP